MTEIEMGTDLSADRAMHVEADEDLIDYDDELVDTGDFNTEKNLEATAGELGEDGASLDTSAAVDTGYEGRISGDVEETYNGQDAGAQENHGTAEPHGSFAEEQAEEAEDNVAGEDALMEPEHGPQNEAGEQISDAHLAGGDDVHGIDFGYDEQQQAEDAEPQIPETHAEDTEGLEHDDDHDQGQTQAGSTHDEVEPVNELGQEPEQSPAAVPYESGDDALGKDQYQAAAHPDTAGEDEITWEEDDKIEEPQREAGEGAHHQDAEQGPGAGDGTELGEPKDEAEELASTQQESYGVGETELPSITVQYKGEEFPLFSLSSEAFFTDVSVLDDNMETLLAGFRSELADEIASDEELVFQVDEMGLEYAEVSIRNKCLVHQTTDKCMQSSPRDSLSHITLRQIIEIFDLLVKNQDPDSTRTLYTYLSTKPNSGRRFELLVESAAAGKGLDEVSHLFVSPIPHNASLAGVVDAAHSHDEFDKYESASDPSGDDLIQDVEAGEEHAYHNDSGNPFEQVDEAGENGEGDEEEHEQQVDENEDQGDLGQADTEPSTEPIAQSPAGPDANGKFKTFIHTFHGLQWTFRHTEARHRRSVSVSSITFSHSDADELYSVTAEAQPDVILTEEVDNDAADSDFDVNEGLPNGHAAERETYETPTADTATTDTVDNDDSIPDTTFGADEAAVENQLDQPNDVEVDEIAEIDWREEPGEEEHQSNASVGAAKRNHTDAELDTADEKGRLCFTLYALLDLANIEADSKRQRS
jgi:hypothetical protein